MHLAHRANLKLLRLIDRTASMRAVTLANQAVRLILAAWLVNHIARTAVTLKETHTERERERGRELEACGFRHPIATQWPITRHQQQQQQR
jgi:hypothetical protein